MEPFNFPNPFAYAEYMKTRGNDDFKNGNYSMAIKNYDEAIRALVFSHPEAQVHGRDMAVLLCNRSNAFYNLNKWNEALMSAQDSLQCDPTYVKGYYRAGYSLIKFAWRLPRHELANHYSRSLNFLLSSSDVVQISEFIVGIFSSTNNVRTVTPQILAVATGIVRENFSRTVWHHVIEKLVKREQWQACLLLASEKDRLPRNLRVTNLPLKDLFDKYVMFGSYERMERVPKLVEWLISMGANINSVGAYPLHAVIKLCINAKGNHLFKWLLDHKPELKALINQQNEDGSTVLHIVASQTRGYPFKNQIEDVEMLLNAGVDPRIRDGHSKSAVDIFKKNKRFRPVEIINKYMERNASFSEKSSVAEQTEAESPPASATLLQEVFDQFEKFCHSEHSAHVTNLLEHKSVRKLLNQLPTVREIPEEVVCDIPPAFSSNLIKLLIKKKKWHEVLLLLTRKATKEMTPGDGPVKNCNLSDLDIGTILNCMGRSDELRVQLIRCLIDRGASPEGTGTLHERPLQKCLQNNDFELAYLLLSSRSNPLLFSIAEGDTPLHAALSICFEHKDDIGLQFLSYLLDLYDSDPSKFSYLNPNVQDKNGNTVMHIIIQKSATKQVKKMLGLLAKFSINFNLKNNLGRDVNYRKKKNDPVLIAWNEAVAENKKRCRHDPVAQVARMAKLTAANNKSQPKSTKLSSSAPVSKMPHGKSPWEGDCSKWEETEDAGVKNLAHRNGNEPLTLREGLVQGIANLIQKFALDRALIKTDLVSSEALKPSMATSEDEKGEHRSFRHEGLDHYVLVSSRDLVEETCAEFNESKEEEEEATEDDQQIQEIEAHTEDFDNMTWEIECTSEMLKKLGNKSTPHYIKKKIIHAIQQLGNGEWTQGLQKRLKHLNADIQLYEAKLDKGARMLWELAIDFSPRCSENAETIIEHEHPVHPTEKTGRVYTEMIRLWDIVLDHNKLDQAIKTTCSAYKRGLSCILRKKLKGINTAVISSNLKTQKRIPRFYVEDTKPEKLKGRDVPEYFPPASAVETEYNIMKFHSFSTNMALNIINDMSSTVEYPFRVGELEYAVIDLNPKPLEPIILIGRSGTGKTTCCLYRLWKKFHSYWEKAECAGGPLLVRQMWRRLKFDIQLENAAAAEEEDHGGKQDSCNSGDSTELDTVESTDDEQQPDEDDQDSSGVDDAEINCVYDCGEEEGQAAKESEKLEHLHQIFITKNHVLCQEVQKNFTELSKSAKATSHFRPLEATVYRLQDVKDENFPLFLTSQQWVLLLDASMPDPFFHRNEDGSLKHTITGWSTKEDFLISNWQEEDDDVDIEVDYDEDEKAAEIHPKEHDPRVYVTYDVFANEIWPHMVKGKCPYNPALVWKEIKSFLKGSIEALSSPQGILTEEEYKKLGRKRSPNFKEDRSEIYQLFSVYQQIKSQRGYFDEEDLLYNLSQRLMRLDDLPWCIHELYGDEIQDFTQAELVLLMKCIDDPNAMFLTGDTAQSIMKGVAFRFSDLRSLFHYASVSSTVKKQRVVRKPKRIYQLYQNYRSHSGILHLASGVVDLLQYYFPESFDRLPRDLGLFDGPKPTVLESCSVSDLAILLRGNKRKTQPIEFGAHQVILVANDTAKERIPEELNLALVLTIYEAKGLEFDDVLLYNFFTDSEAYKEWKIISHFTPSCNFTEENKLIIETPLEKVTEHQGKPQVLNTEMYKMLNGELKQLYTAITRARVNLWIFDENCDRRAPAFQYFIKRELVQVVKTDENKDLDDSMFVKTSTSKEWIAQGEYYAKHQCWKVAAKCFQKGGAVEKEKLALAHDAVLKVQSKKISPKDKQMEYMDLAKTYLECGEPNLALKCLIHAKEYRLCAQLCEKLGRVKDAAYFYKRGQCYKDAFRCFEQIQEFDLALKICCCEELYEEAAQCVERFEKMVGKERQLASKLSYTSNQFYLLAADRYSSANKVSEMMAVLSHLNTEDQLVFLKDHKYFSEAADLLKREGRDEEAAKLMKQHGFVLEAADLTNQKDFRASCLLAAARLSIAGVCKLQNLKAILEEALVLCEQTKQKSGSAEATYLIGMEEKDFSMLKKAFHMFLFVNHPAGAVGALFGATQCDKKSENFLRLVALYGIETILSLVKAFQKAATNAEKEMVKSCFDYFGIAPVDKKFCQVSQNEAGCILEFFSECATLREKKTSDQFIVSLEEVKSALNKYLLNRLVAITHHLFEQSFPNVCTKFIAGLKCEDENCEDFHKTLSRHEIKSIFQCKKHLATINGLLLEAKRVFQKYVFCEPNVIDELLTADKYSLCKSLVNAFFPKHFHLRMVSENPVACKEILSLHSGGYRTLNPCTMVLREYIRSELKNETPKNRRESTDLWLKVMQVFALTSGYPEEFEKLVFREEDEYDRELKLLSERGRVRLKGVEGRYGMLMLDKYAENAESTHLCFIRLLQNSVDQLYTHRNIEECRFLFYRFMNVLVKKCIDPLIPSIGNTVALLEFQFIFGCAVLMRLCKSMTLCLPKSYISLLHYWDFLFRRGDYNKDFTYSVIQDYKPEDTKKAIKDFKKHLMYLADVLCCYEEFSVLMDAFEDPDYITSGEAERTVVLCLVMLINADQVLSWKYRMVFPQYFPTIKERLLKLKVNYPTKVPERLLKTVSLMSEVSEVKEVVKGLKELLFCRDGEFLADCHWKWEPRGTRGIFYEVADLDRFAYLKQPDAFEEPEMDFEKDVYVEERKDPLANIASIRQQKQQQKASARRKLQCLFLFVRCCIRWKRFSSSKPESLETPLEVFKRADVDGTQCDLCGVKFVQSPDKFVTRGEDSEKEPTEATRPIEGDWEENVERNEFFTAGKTFETHIILDEHKNKHAAYQRYYDFFKKEVDPVIRDGKDVMESIRENACIRGHLMSKECSKLEQRKIQEVIKKISDAVEDIYKRKAWSDAEEILSKLARNLCTNLDEARKWLKKTESSLQQEEEFDYDKDLDDEVKGEEFNFEELHPKKTSRKWRKHRR
ncbi:TPR and ankyrin repeat-containing protein 1 isoform X2 [Sphaerodactylus townsendi]|uniref:TPR and ankyrin repeat-containing protein 1 isoform X2 n=1 Tax=Sphaerodactylus townsendi TaxID=933632 RepID=UPI002026A95E|nr:TPR and ankyrin repeat-containing protein 1 isoform X2 [Sphaerodactylus townsendi]